MTEWMPIESAPKDGTTILIFDPSWKQAPWRQYVAARWMVGKSRFESGDWQHANATHWMPLPEPPTNAEEPKR